VRRRLGVRAAAFIACVLAAATIACDPTVQVEGTVHDSQGKPLEGVTVTLQSEGRQPHQTVTAKDGTFGLGIVGAEAGQTKLVFQKDGYVTREQPLTDAHIHNLQVVLAAK
jgi:hypothetical protein